MTWRRITSTSLSAIGYDVQTRVLEVRFNGGRCFRYFGVPRSIYAALMVADSVGVYFYEWVQERYPYIQVA